MRIQIPAGPAQVLTRLERAGHKAYVVGGCVRDALLGRMPHDWDVCTSALPEETLACFSGFRVMETGLRHGTVTVLVEGEGIEVTTYRVDGTYTDHRRPDGVRFVSSLEEDLARRDFTINAMAAEIEGRVVDCFGGRKDLEAGLIRCVGEVDRRFTEDALRILRGLRFAAVYGFALEEETAAAVHRNRTLLTYVAKERIRAELERLIIGPGAGEILREFSDVFEVFLPMGLSGSEKLEDIQNRWIQTTRTIERGTPLLVVRLALLFLGLERPVLGETEAVQGADLAECYLKRLRFDNRTVRQVTELMRCVGTVLPEDRAGIRRCLNRLGETQFRRLLAVKRAALTDEDRLDLVQVQLESVLARGECYSLVALAVSGQDLIDLEIPSGPEVGRYLNTLLDLVLEGTCPNRREALLERAKGLREQ